MRRKIQNQLGSNRKYLQIMAKKIGLFSYGGLICFLAILGLFGSVVLVGFYLTIAEGGGGGFLDGPSSSLNPFDLAIPLVVGWLSILLLLHSKSMFVKATAIDPVKAITDRSVHLLPLQDTLVRGSEEPPVAQSDILLRAATWGPETPPEQPLRPTVEE